ncbi:hypothetical protein MMC25_007869 [Agyrium rufum]|nr:hypothetical protein [Agyrium rufum]
MGIFGIYVLFIRDTRFAVPHPRGVTKALVMAKTRSDDVTWARELMPGWTPYIYTADNEPGYPLKMPNVGREAMAYLTFIVDYYDSLPAYIAFVHSAPENWHNDGVLNSTRTKDVIDHLRLDAVKEQGYVNLRCYNSPGCPLAISPHRPSKTDIANDDTRAHMIEIYRGIFGGEEKDVPVEIGGVCCAQFALTRERITQRPREDYIRMRKWALTTDLDTFGIGWVYENVWHIVFGEESVYCPSEEQCKCKVYGICDR